MKRKRPAIGEPPTLREERSIVGILLDLNADRKKERRADNEEGS